MRPSKREHFIKTRGSVMRSAFLLLLSIALTAASAHSKTPEPGEYEPSKVTLSASEVVPPHLMEKLKGPHYQVDEAVINKEAVNNFTLKTDFGDIPVFINYTLHKRLLEVPAIAQLKQTTQTEAFGQALIAAGTMPFDTAIQVVTNPLETAAALPGGFWRMLKQTASDIGTGVQAAGDAISGTGGDSDKSVYARSAEAGKKFGKAFFKVNSAKRELAMELQVDPYTRNAVLQEELERVAWVRSAGKFADKFNPVKLPKAMGYINDAGSLVWNKSPNELKESNEKALTEMGVGPKVIEKFFKNGNYIPSEQTRMVAALRVLETTQDRPVFLNQVAGVTSMWEVIFYIRLADFLAVYHKEKEPIAGITDAGVEWLFAIASSGNVLLILPVDYLNWHSEAADILKTLTENARALHGKNYECWIEGRISDRARKELTALGWQVTDQALERLTQ